MGRLLLLALLVALGTWLSKKFVRAWANKKRRALPGYSPATALVVNDFDAMDAFVAKQLCYCGGRLKVLGESSRHGPAQSPQRVRVILTECQTCEEEQGFFFVTKDVLH